MSEEAKATARHYFEAFASKDLAWLDEHVAPDFVRHDQGLPSEVRGREGVRHLNSVLLTAFPDLRLDVEDEVAEGDKVLMRLTLRATHRGEFMDIPPTGNEVEVGVLDLFRIVEGRLEEHWAMVDNLGMMQQLGAIPTEEQSEEASST